MTEETIIKKTTNGTIVFRAVFFSLVGIIIVALIIGLNIFSGFLSDYEKSQQKYAVEPIIAELKQGNFDKLFAATEIEVSEFETEDDYKKAFTAVLGAELSYMKNPKESTDDAPVYSLRSDGKTFALLKLKKTGEKNGSGFEIFAFDSVYGVDVAKNEQVTVTVPDEYKVSINGVQPTAGFITKTEAVDGAELFGKYLTVVPKIVTYHVDSLINKPSVKITDASGKEISADYDESKKTYRCGEKQCDDKTATDYALEFSHRYSEYIANDIGFSVLAGYIKNDVALYNDMYNYEGKYYQWHSSYEFKNDTIVSATAYDDNCVAVHVKYDHIVVYGEEHIFPADNTVYLYMTENGWKVVALKMN